jgi:sugar phosphate isomerase/epimerase
MPGRRVADIAPAGDGEFAAAMDDMRRWVELFAALGIRAGVLHLGGDRLRQAGWSDARIFARRIEAVHRVAEFAKGGPTWICLENGGENSGVCSHADFARVIEAVGMDNVAICLDTGHANLAKVDNPTFIRAAGRHLRALHIADNLGQHDDHMLPYGRGTVNWAEVMKALQETGYDGLFNFEVPGENRCPAPIRLAKLDYARSLAEAMIRMANG